jgi:hypothetical protein
MVLPRTTPDPLGRFGALLSDYQNRLKSLEIVAHSHDSVATGIWYRNVTSTTRPSPAIEGTMIYERDTDRVLVYDGVGWIILAEPSQAWTPTLAGLTVGNGTWSAFTHRSDGWIDLEASFTFGTTSAITGDLILTLPVNGALSTPDLWTVQFRDDNVATQFLGVADFDNSVSTVRLRAVAAGGTYASSVACSATIPFTWTTSDRIFLAARYRMTTRYS